MSANTQATPPGPRAQRGGFDRWTKGPGNARGRIAQGVVVPETVPGFMLSPDTRVFNIGSCFARTVETALLSAGVQVTSVGRKTDIMEVQQNMRRGFLNMDTPVSIHQELEWAAGVAFPEASLLPYGDEWVDPFLSDRAPTGNLVSTRSRRARLKEYFARAFAADLVIVTLGMTEAWYDRKTKQALNGAPHPRAFVQDKARFGMKRLGYDEVLTTLKSACTIIRRQNPKAKILLTISPVPLEHTFAPEDIMVANMISKNTLHVAATAIATGSEGIDYFPAYEAVMLSDPARAWMPDRRSVAPEMVRAIVDTFMRRYGLALKEDTATAGTA